MRAVEKKIKEVEAPHETAWCGEWPLELSAGKAWFENAGIAVSEMPKGELFGVLVGRVGE